MKPKKYIQIKLKYDTKESTRNFIMLMLKMAWSKSDKVYYRLCLKELEIQTA